MRKGMTTPTSPPKVSTIPVQKIGMIYIHKNMFSKSVL